MKKSHSVVLWDFCLPNKRNQAVFDLLFIFLVYPLLIAKRIKNEQQVLEAGLPGYKEYKQKVKYRMIPYIW